MIEYICKPQAVNPPKNARKEFSVIIKEIANIDESFFDIDKANKTAGIELRYSKTSDIFDNSCMSKMPVLNDDFMDSLIKAFRRISSRYKIDLKVRFDDMDGYSQTQLADIFKKNIELELRSRLAEKRKRKSVAIGLIITGVLFFITMMLIQRLWNSSSVWKDIFVYAGDIATTITFWEALIILVVEQKKSRAYLNDLRSRFSSISFTE